MIIEQKLWEHEDIEGKKIKVGFEVMKDKSGWAVLQIILDETITTPKKIILHTFESEEEALASYKRLWRLYRKYMK